MDNKLIESGIIENSKTKNKTKGNVGEALAVEFLKKKGYKILEQNYKTKMGEIDIIAKDKNNRIIFVEVKARETAKFGYPREAITREKQQKLRMLAECYLKFKHLTKSLVRMDVIEVLAGEITHIENAF